jgi:hypothetical protein
VYAANADADGKPRRSASKRKEAAADVETMRNL